VKKTITFLFFIYICFTTLTNDVLFVGSGDFFFDYSKSLILSNKDISKVHLNWKDSILIHSPLSDTIVIDTIVTDTTLTDTILIDTTLIDSTLADTTIIDSVLIDSTLTDTIIHIKLDSTFYLIHPTDSIKIGICYQVASPAILDTFKLYFTELPIISITTEGIITNEPKIQAKFRMVESDQTETTSNIGIEIRGGWTQRLDKKSYKIEFWKDEKGDTARDVSLLGMRSDDDWNLQAMANEPLRVRNKTNNQLWKKIYTPYYKDSVPDAVNGIDMNYAELFINGAYQGIYCISEVMDRKQLQLKKYKDSIRGELYKGVGWGASSFTKFDMYDNNSNMWCGFQYEYPDEIVDWSNIYDFVRFTLNESEKNFYAQYQSKFDLDNAVDYYLFINLLRATDNMGKNAYIAKYDQGEPYFYVPWDLDGTLGTIYNGERENIYNDLLYNGLYVRMWYDFSVNGFRDRLMYRWINLRKDVITQENIMNEFMKNHDLLLRNGVYEREKIAWNDYKYDSTQIEYTSKWLLNRLNYMDNYSQINYKQLVTKADKNNSILKPTVYPNPASDHIFVRYDQETEAKFYIFNNLGQLLLIESIIKGENRISLEGLNNGVYYLKIVSTDMESTTPFIIQK